MNSTLKTLTVNVGSSSLKVALYQMDECESRLLTGKVDGIGSDSAQLIIKDEAGNTVADSSLGQVDHSNGLRAFLDWLRSQEEYNHIDGIGHRVVHGGSQFSAPALLTPEVLAALKQKEQLAPDHIPNECAAIEAAMDVFPLTGQVVCFDTAFHRTMPPIAQAYPFERSLETQGVIKYGFHGLSYEYIMTCLDPDESQGRVVIAHLGNGASMVAVRNGRSVDTTMGFTPAGGLMMGTRSGDLDPGVLFYLMRQRGLTVEEIDRVVNHESGLYGVSGTSSDVRALMAAASGGDQRAAFALDLFCYVARKFLGSLTAVLGGLDTLVFTGGIGENAAQIRASICAGMEYLGMRIDAERNAGSNRVISAEGSPVKICVIKTNEELMIARHTAQLLRTNS